MGGTYVVAIGVDAPIYIICLKADEISQLCGVLSGVNKSIPEVILRSDLIHACYR